MSDRHRTLTPAPVTADTPATMGDVFTVAGEHAAACAEHRAKEAQHLAEKSSDQQGVVWGRIVAVEQAVADIRTSLRFAVKLAVLTVGLAGAFATVGVFFAKYAIVGAITIELDKRMPYMQAPRASLDNPDADHYAQVRQP